MKQNLSYFRFSKNQNFILKASRPLSEICFCGEVEIFFINHGVKTLVSRTDCSLHVIRHFFERLQLLLNHELKITSLNEIDIGFLWNEYLHEDVKEIAIKKLHNQPVRRCLLWQAPGKATFLFEKNDTFFMEIAPVYLWHFGPPGFPAGRKRPYKQFVKNYEPFEVLEIPRSVIEQWEEQASNLFKIMQENEEKYDRLSEADKLKKAG